MSQSRSCSKPDKSATTALPTLAVLVVPETTGSVLYGMYDLFRGAGRDWGMVTTGEPGPELIRPLLVARASSPVEIYSGVAVTPHATLDQCPPDAVICVPELNVPPGMPLFEHYSQEIAWLQARYAQGATLAAACSGAMLFAEAGLLDGFEATTHWAWCAEMRERFPKVTVREQRALVVSGKGQRLIMAGGGTSFLDLALYLVARTVGIDVAMQAARVNLIDWHTIGQQPFARLARTRQCADAVIARCQEWIAEHYARPSPVAAMQRLSGLAERTFKRRFAQATGMSPIEYVHALRIEEAKHLLETTDVVVEGIANEVGYEDAGYFSRLFREKVGLTPMQYRRRFGALRQALQREA
jgi:transcriptional regulator GlxA family with amidase domain